MGKAKRDAGDGIGKRPAPLWDSDEELKAEELDLSSSEESGDDSEGEFADAVLDYMQAVRQKDRPQNSKKSTAKPPRADDHPKGTVESDDVDEERGSEGPEGVGNEEDSDEIFEQDEASDSSEDERPNRNTVGNVPLEWYNDEEHIGYDIKGRRIAKGPRRDALERLLARSDSAKEWRTVYDEYNDEEIVLSKEEMQMIQRIRAGKFAHVEINPFEPENDWFSRDTETMPLSGAPEPKSRFVPSKWEEKRVVKLVRAMRKGWINRTAPEERPSVYMLWLDDGKVADKTAVGLTYIPAPKLKLPGHEESYNPPKEYLPSEEERNAALLEAESAGARPPVFPTLFESLRKVPAYADFIRERFERCLDLYLCPRTRVKRLNIDDPESLVPKLPKPKDLQPFPSAAAIRYLGHVGPVRSICTDLSGKFLASAGADGTVRLWEVQTGRCMRTWQVSTEGIACVTWCPNPLLSMLAVASGPRVYLIPTGKGNEAQTEATIEALAAALAAFSSSGGDPEDSSKLTQWQRVGNDAEDLAGSVVIEHKFVVKQIAWHARGDYFSSVAPLGNTRAVLVHQLSRGASQNPFRKNRGRVVRAMFHPTKPFFFVATQQAVRVYNLAKQALAKKLVGGSGVITSMDIHPSGDHVIVGAEDRRLCWYDLDLSVKPYKALRYHGHAVRGAAFHRSYPLFASASDDATVHVFHGMVYADLMTNPLIVPVKILRGHARVDANGVLDVVFHPTQPWLFSAGADGVVCLFVNP